MLGLYIVSHHWQTYIDWNLSYIVWIATHTCIQGHIFRKIWLLSFTQKLSVYPRSGKKSSVWTKKWPKSKNRGQDLDSAYVKTPITTSCLTNLMDFIFSQIFGFWVIIPYFKRGQLPSAGNLAKSQSPLYVLVLPTSHRFVWHLLISWNLTVSLSTTWCEIIKKLAPGMAQKARISNL